MKAIIGIVSTAIISGILFLSCSKGGSDDSNPPTTNPACVGTPGPLFTSVKGLMQANCQSCHNSSTLNGGMDWTVDCNIVTYKDRIKARAVDLGTMPPTGPLPQSEKNKITAWINAGGRITD
jgi:uncharacterized membrane protein